MKKITTIFLILLMSIPTLMLGSELRPTNWLNDFTGVLTREQQNSINEKLSNFEKSTSIEISYAIVPSLENQSIEEFTNKLFREWGVGKKGANNGLLIVIAPNEHKFRVEPGYGLEPFLTDNICERLSMADFPDNFRANNYFDGIMSFTDDVITHLGKISWEDRLEMQKKQLEAQKTQRDNIISTIIGIVVFIIIAFLIIISIIKVRKENEKNRKFKEEKQKLVDKYKGTILTLNKSLSIYKVKNVIEDTLVTNQILTSKTQEDAIKIYNQVIDSLKPNYELIDILAKFNDKTSELEKTYKELTVKERFHNISVSLKPYYGEPICGKDLIFHENIDKIQEYLSNISNLISKYNARINEISKYESLLGYFAGINDKNVDSLIDNRISKYVNSEYKISESDAEGYRVKLKEKANKIINEKKSFDNMINLELDYKSFIETQQSFNGYVNTIEDLNTKHKSMIDMLKNRNIKISNYITNFDKFYIHSDVSESTKNRIREFAKTAFPFEETSDLISSYNRLTNLYDKSDDLVRLAQSDIKKEKEKRDEIERKKRDEEERIRRKKRQEEEDEEARIRRKSYHSSSSYYNSGYSSSSSSDSSSFGGFGGGDSGGGGFSGDW